METNELMIGDWVNFGGDLPRYSKVTELRTHDIQVCNYWIDKECITPIPLTPEILEKNGFKEMEFTHKSYGFCLAFEHNKEYICIYWRDSCNTMTSDGREDFVSELWSIEIHNKEYSFIKDNDELYIHELQHALRLCGFNDLADNFKI